MDGATESRWAVFRDPLLVRMLGFGFYSGLPLPLTIWTLQQWFTVSGVSIHAVSLTASLGLPYVLKFLWSPLFDRPPPRWAGGVGRRRFWLLVVQPLLALACLALALTHPDRNAALTAVAAIFVAFFSASQDIVIDAWRIDTFAPEQQGIALAAYIWGYRAALLAAYPGIVGLSTVLGWRGAMLTVPAVLLLAPLLVLSAPEPALKTLPARLAGPLAAFRQAFLDPLLDFLRRPRAAEVLAFVILFKLGKVFADNTAASFYHNGLGFGSGAVAAANAAPQLVGVLLGAAFGALLVARFGVARAALLAGALQAVSLALYPTLLLFPNPVMLAIKVGGEYFAAASADAAFLAFLSTLCNRTYTATQYALLSSAAAIVFHTVGGAAGYAAEALGWFRFYAACIALSLPALLIMLHLQAKDPAPAG
jgi:PAT family beta-lactamase induction signal transducer AmpG